MGSVVKSIGKAVKKIGKGLKKVIKKIGPALIIAAAVWAGVAMLGAGGAAGAFTSSATGAFDFGVANFSKGLGVIGKGISGLFLPSSSSQTTGLAAAQAGGRLGTYTGGASTTSLDYAAGGRNALAASQGISLVGASTADITKWIAANNAPASGMTTGDALIYMTKMNMLSTGVQMAAGFLDNKEEKQLAMEEKLLDKTLAANKELAQMNIDAAKEMEELKYSYGAPSGNLPVDWKQSHPSLIPSQTLGAATTAPQMPQMAAMQQSIGEPVFGRSSTRQFETGAPRASGLGTGAGLITRGSERRLS